MATPPHIIDNDDGHAILSPTFQNGCGGEIDKASSSVIGSVDVDATSDDREIEDPGCLRGIIFLIDANGGRAI